MNMKVQMVPEEIQALQRELRNHPDLWETIKVNTNTFEDVIASVCDHFDIVMHGVYDEAAIRKLCQMLVQRLQDKRKVIITDPSKFALPDAPTATKLKHF